MVESEPIRRRKLSHEVLDRLLARITRGELAAGEHLPSERDLMSHYGSAVLPCARRCRRWSGWA